MPEHVKELLKKLESNDRKKWLDAINGLGSAAQKGEDISAGAGALEKALSSEDSIVRVRAGWALAMHRLQKGEMTKLAELYTEGGAEVRNGVAQALSFWVRRGADISLLVPALEKDLDNPELGSRVVSGLSDFYILKGMDKEYSELLNKDESVRFGAVAVCRSAASDGKDISKFVPALKKALGDSDASVSKAAAGALVTYYAKRRRWEEINPLLVHKKGIVRYAAVDSLYSFAGLIDIPQDLPNLLKTLQDGDLEVGKCAMGIIRSAAEKGRDISYAVPILKASSLKEEAGLALKTYELMKDAGGRCAKCLGCELGRKPGDESGSIEDLSSIVKEIPCCAGIVTHSIFRCKECGKYFSSSYYDHTGFESEQYSIQEISKEEAESATLEIKKCKNPEDKKCSCIVHKEFLKNDALPIKGVLKFSETID